MNKEVSVKLDRVYEVINRKKSAENDEVAKLKARIEELQKRPATASTSSEVAKPSSEAEEVARLHNEQVELKKAMDKRLAAMEEVIHASQRQCEEAETNAETWKAEALRPGNKRGGVVIGPTPMTQTRLRPRLTLAATRCTVGRVDEHLKGIVERHQKEVELLKEMCLKEVNARKESELEIERLKEEMKRLEMENRAKTRSNLKTRLDEVAGPSARKTKKSDVAGLAQSTEKDVDLNSKDAFLRAARKQLRGKKKEEVISICEKEGVTYTTLDPTKEAIAQKRTSRAFDDRGADLGKGKEVSTHVVSDDEKDSEDDGRDSAVS
ncbi:hypothetical protein CBR_g622 [Chara braunii]|uniref:Uncharacterized protein n=1 Tax=Chara braunii TaxID=69332 RepID=A0A388KBT5_CHABU|nr:hypothetical protein CBR_g622 [Chara braunii]|eukprot:GBG67487.1 hypothetical protein CBR_g622 [Chara braunii]